MRCETRLLNCYGIIILYIMFMIHDQTKITHLFGLFAGCVGDSVGLNFLTGNHWPDEIIHVAISDYIAHNRFAEHGAR